MELSVLIAQVRRQSDDGVSSAQLWSDDDITLYLNEAQRDACIRAKLIRDGYTDEITLIPITTTAVTPDTPNGFNYKYALDPTIFAINMIEYVDTKVPILEASEDQYKRHRWHHRYGYGYGGQGLYGDYNTASAGRATAYWPEKGSEDEIVLRLLPYPNASTYVDGNGDTQTITMRLTVYRTQLVDMSDPTDTPEIATRWHMGLVDGACARMFMRRDRDTYDPVKANGFEQTFTATFGQKIDANTLRQRTEYRRNRTTFRFPA